MWDVIYNGANTVFKQMPLLFAIGLPISLAKKQQGRACLEAFVIYVSFLYITSTILGSTGDAFLRCGFCVHSKNERTGHRGDAKTLDMGMIGALLISGISVYLHNKFFDAKMPKYIESFKGSPLVVLIGFAVMLPVGLIACFIWPHIQAGIAGLQSFLADSGVLGVGI